MLPKLDVLRAPSDLNYEPATIGVTASMKIRPVFSLTETETERLKTAKLHNN